MEPSSAQCQAQCPSSLPRCERDGHGLEMKKIPSLPPSLSQRGQRTPRAEPTGTAARALPTAPLRHGLAGLPPGLPRQFLLASSSQIVEPLGQMCEGLATILGGACRAQKRQGLGLEPRGAGWG